VIAAAALNNRQFSPFIRIVFTPGSNIFGTLTGLFSHEMILATGCGLSPDFCKYYYSRHISFYLSFLLCVIQVVNSYKFSRKSTNIPGILYCSFPGTGSGRSALVNTDRQPFKFRTMKKPIRILLMLATGIIAFSGCQKETDDLIPVNQNKAESAFNESSQPLPGISWSNNFNTEASLLQSFYLVGSPAPVWVDEACGRQGLFDNNATSPTAGYGISKVPIGNGGPVVIEAEVYLKITDANGYCVCPGLGITLKDYQPLVLW